jgi:DNA-binding MarR family transcriptional regulator
MVAQASMKKARTEEDADIGALQLLVGYRMRRAMTVVTADFMAAVEPLGMRPVLFSLLAVIDANPGIIQTRLGRALGIQRANLVPLLGALGERGLVRREESAADRRATALHLTADGEALLAETLERVKAHERRVLAPLSEDERRQLSDMLARIAAQD